ncbi:MAG: hypothetical protein GEU99_16380 [Luteitalea sp.]|nr:hypothetical protein [Luteitalea sp.]
MNPLKSMAVFRRLLEAVVANTAYMWAFLGLVIALNAFVITSDAVQLFLWSAFLLAQGSVCWYGYRLCGRAHCRVTGPGFLVIGLLMFATAVIWLVGATRSYLVTPAHYLASSSSLLILVGGIIAVSFAYEGYVTAKTGSPFLPR